MNYVATVFFHTGAPVKFLGNDPDELEARVTVLELEAGGIKAWRIVNRLSGKCMSYWKEGENAASPAYSV